MTTVVEQKQTGKRMAGETRLNDQPDEALLVGYRETGDREAFTELVHRYEREIYSYLRRYLGNAQMAEDAFQQTFLQVHLKCDQFQEGRRFRPWVYTIATHQAIDLQRRNKRHRMVSLDGSGQRDDVESVGTLLALLEGSEQDPLKNLEQEERREHRQQEDQREGKQGQSGRMR